MVVKIKNAPSFVPQVAQFFCWQHGATVAIAAEMEAFDSNIRNVFMLKFKYSVYKTIFCLSYSMFRLKVKKYRIIT